MKHITLRPRADFEPTPLLKAPQLSEETELMIGDLCMHRPFFVDVADPLHIVLDAMAEKRLGSVLVLKEGELAGLFTAVDACRLLSQTLLEQFAPNPPGTTAA